MEMIISESEMLTCLSGLTASPHTWLGINPVKGKGGWVVRAMDSHACSVQLVGKDKQTRVPLTRIHEKGFFETEIDEIEPFSSYTFLSQYEDSSHEWVDPYAFEPYVKNQDLELFNQGIDRRPYEKLGAIPVSHQGVPGVSFVVWAPSAKSVHLTGDFNLWNPVNLPMRSLGSSGCRELFVPFATMGQKYKYRVLGADNILREKTDPFAFSFEPPTGNASIIADRSSLNSFREISDGAAVNQPVSIYEMHLGSWQYHTKENRPLSYFELSQTLPAYLREMNFTHVEFLPPSEYPYGASWGYQVTGYYAPTHRYGSPEDFARLVKAIQDAGVGVLIDWVPAHFPADEFSLAKFDGTCLFEHQDPRQGEHAEWGTLCYNYGRAEVKSFLIGSAISWLERFGVDGYRVDAVASMLYLDYGRKEGEWIPNKYGGNHNLEAVDFIRLFNQSIHEEFPSVLSIAEESTAFPQITQPPSVGGLGFDFKWNMGWMHDTLDYFSTSPFHRSNCHDKLTFGAMYQFSENFIQAFSHDEVVHGKGSLANKMNLGDPAHRLANLRSLYALQWSWPGKKTLFMGSEFGQWKEWDFESPLDWALLEFPFHAGLKRLVSDLNKLYSDHPTWASSDHKPDKFQWIDCNDYNGQTLSFLKYGELPKDTLLVACNFSDQNCHRDWGCPHPGNWQVILDTDAPDYGGHGDAGASGFESFKEGRNGQPFGLSFSVSRRSVRILSLVE